MAGYPEAHPDVISEDPEKMKEAYWSDIHYLKEKVCIRLLVRLAGWCSMLAPRRLCAVHHDCCAVGKQPYRASAAAYRWSPLLQVAGIALYCLLNPPLCIPHADLLCIEIVFTLASHRWMPEARWSIRSCSMAFFLNFYVHENTKRYIKKIGFSNFSNNVLQVDAGGEVVVTQLFYDVEVFLQFVKDCRSVGVTVPIIPGNVSDDYRLCTRCFLSLRKSFLQLIEDCRSVGVTLPISPGQFLANTDYD